MCGIVGYWGPRNPCDVIVSGLKRLEYRGYDSAGVAIFDGGRIKRVRAPGKLAALEQKLKSESFDGHTGIGHTRWATHGGPSERNAHPHQVDGVSLVHNGIIENYQDIKQELLRDGAQITSDTDSELVAHLIARAVAKDGDLLRAVQGVRSQLRGAYSILVIWEKQPDLMIAFKDGPPLIVGLGKEESVVVSDIQAGLSLTRKFLYLEDGEIARLAKGSLEVFGADGRPVSRIPTEIDWTVDQAEKSGFPHFMLKEVHEQSRVAANSLEPFLDPATRALRPEAFATLPDFERVVISACGTSYYSGLYCKYVIESFARVPVEIDVASEFRYRNPVISPNTLMISISQSGETADTLAAVRLAKAQGAKVLSLSNVKGSTIDREAHVHLFMNAGVEVGVASTKAFLSSLCVLNALALGIAKKKGVLRAEQETEIVDALLSLPSLIEVVLAYDKYFATAAESLKKYKGFLYMGRGVQFPVAQEGALKLKELAYLHAEGFPAGEMKHGPLAMIDERMAIVVIAPKDQWYEKTLSNLEEARARGGKIIALGTGDDDKLSGLSEQYLSLPQTHWSTYPMLSVVPLQLMAYHLACSLDHDVDQPRNLAKSVTVE